MPSTAIVGKRLPSIRLMEAQFSSSFSAPQEFLQKIAQFVPYSFKELADVDLVEYSALCAFNLIKYVTGIQRLCVPEDVFWYAFWNTDADGDRLLIKGCSGSTCVVGWHEIAVAFGANHTDAEEFRAIKINNKNFSQYRAGEYLAETVETNAQRKLVNGQPYEEISYYKEAAPYGPTYFLMNVISGIILVQRKKHPLHYSDGLRLHEVASWIPDELGKGTPLATADSWVAWVHLSKEGDIDSRGLHSKIPDPIEDIKCIRESCKLSDSIPIAEPVTGEPVGALTTCTPSKMPIRKRSREIQDTGDVPVPDDIDPEPSKSSSESPPRTVRTRLTKKCKNVVASPADPGPSAGPDDGPDDDVIEVGRSADPIFRDFGKNLGIALGKIASKKLEAAFLPLLVNAKASDAFKQQLADVSVKKQEAERARSDLNDQVTALKAELASKSNQVTALKAELATRDQKAGIQLQRELDQAKKRAADAQTLISKLEADLKLARAKETTRDSDRDKMKAEVKSLNEQLEALKGTTAVKQAKIEQEMSVLQEQLQKEKMAAAQFKEAFQSEMKRARTLDEQVLNLNGLMETQKFTLDRAEKALAGVGWAPVLVHLLHTFRERLFPNSPLASIDHWAQWRLTTQAGDLTFSSLSAKFKESIADIDKISELCKYEELEDEPEATEAPAQGKKAAARTKSPQGKPGSRPPMRGSVAPSVSAPMATVSSSSDPDTYGSIESVEDFCAVISAEIQELLSVKVTSFYSKFAFQGSLLQEKYDALGKEHSVKVGELQATNETLTKQVKDLKENSTSKLKELKANNERLVVKVTGLNCAKEAHGVKIHDLEKHVDILNNKYNASANLLKEKDAALKAALAAQTSSKGELEELHRLRVIDCVSAGALQRSKVEMEKELSVLKLEKTTATGQLATVTASYNAVKLALDKESHALTEAQVRIETLQDELNTLQYKLEASEKGRTTTRQDLATARAQLRQASYLGNVSAPQEVPRNAPTLRCFLVH
ncbi:hypothetical protein R1sor_016744 [Riccia sorocarpa]|uniref:Uncharacterized protein n=1 Tax=Riccia sorocarpa TaxID=122646 RepID=A0ABD3HFT8_9MARC